jgi:hypothetical protein
MSNFPLKNKKIYLPWKDIGNRSCNGTISIGNTFTINNIFTDFSAKNNGTIRIKFKYNSLSLSSYNADINVDIILNSNTYNFSKKNVDSRNGIILDSTTGNIQLLLYYDNPNYIGIGNQIQSWDFIFIVFDKNINNPSLDLLDLNNSIKLLVNESNKISKLNLATNFDDGSLYDILYIIIKQKLGIMIPCLSILTGYSAMHCPGGRPPVVPNPGPKPNQGQFTMPWNQSSNVLYIALPIDINSHLGKEIDTRIRIVSGSSPFGPTSGIIKTPHVSLLSIFIKNGSILDNFLKNQSNFNSLAQNITASFKNNIVTNSLQLHSDKGHYEILGKWLTRAFDDTIYLQILKNHYIDFKKNVNYLLLNNVKNFPVAQFTNFINTQQNINPHQIANNSPPQTFTHYSINPNTFPNSETAISSFFTDNFLPHISLMFSTDPKNIPRIQAAGLRNGIQHPMSYLNLWGSQDKKNVPGVAAPMNGSISHVYVAYDNKQSWTPL